MECIAGDVNNVLTNEPDDNTDGGAGTVDTGDDTETDEVLDMSLQQFKLLPYPASASSMNTSAGSNKFVPVGAVPWNAVAYGNGKFVAVGLNQQTTSTDGIAWTNPTGNDTSSSANPPNALGYWSGLCWYSNAGLFVSVGGVIGTPNSGCIAYSPDGVYWTLVTTTSSAIMTGVASGMFNTTNDADVDVITSMVVAVSQNGYISYSLNTLNGLGTWTTNASPLTEHLSAICAVTVSDSSFFVVASKSASQSSSIPTTMGYINSATSSELNYTPSSSSSILGCWTCVASGMIGGTPMVVALGNTDGSLNQIYSTDGQTWSASATPQISADWNSVTYATIRGVNMFIGVETAGEQIIVSRE
jgi:hypothetical protein